MVQAEAPDYQLVSKHSRFIDSAARLTIQALASGTIWSISTSEAAVQVAPSYGLFHVPDVEAQAESVTTPVPSRFNTVSRVLQAPLMVIQCGNKSREYPVVVPAVFTVSPARSVLALEAVGILLYHGVSNYALLYSTQQRAPMASRQGKHKAIASSFSTALKIVLTQKLRAKTNLREKA